MWWYKYKKYRHAESSHTDEQSNCEECTFKGREKTQLNSHIELPNSCEKCDSQTKYKYRVKSHRKINYSDETHQRMCECTENAKEIGKIETKIAVLESEHLRSEILKNFKHLSENPESINIANMWKLLKKISSRVKPILFYSILFRVQIQQYR